MEYEKYRDTRPILWVLIYYFITILGYWHFHYLYIPILCYFSFACATITHNTIHCSVFKNKIYNEIFEILLSISYGHPVSSFIPGHNKSHHVYTQTSKDAMRTTKLQYKWHLLNLLLFQQTVSPQILINDIKYITSQKGTYFYKKAIREFRIVMLLNSLLFFLEFKKFFLLFHIPHLFAQWAIVSINMLQHDGCDIKEEINSARNFTGSILNYLTFNNGYHTIHHINPTLHWTKIPEMHNKYIEKHNHPNLNQKNMLTYAFKTFIYPGKRIDYLGNPVILYNIEDEQWHKTNDKKNGEVIYEFAKCIIGKE
jgi:fatty acid desaturase